MEASYDDYERFRAYDLAFHAIVMKASGNEVGLTIVRVIHRHGGVSAARSSAGSLARRAEQTTPRITARSSRRSRPRDGELAGERIAAHIELAWAERKEQLAGGT